MQAIRKKGNLRTIFSALLFLAILSYFCYHMMSGDRGIFALLQLQRKVEETRGEMELVHAEKMGLEHKVSMLREESLDLDLLDEQARGVLGYAEKDEIVLERK